MQKAELQNLSIWWQSPHVWPLHDDHCWRLQAVFPDHVSALKSPPQKDGVCLLARPYFRTTSVVKYVSLVPDEIISTVSRNREYKVNKSSTHAQELSRLNVKEAKADLKWLKWQKVKLEWSEWITKACMNSITQVKQIQYQFNFWPCAEGKQGQGSRRVKGNEQLYYFFPLYYCIRVSAAIY